MRVLASVEGLLGKTTASGYVIDMHVPFVALPSTKALYQLIRVTNPANGRSCIALCLDVGPWNLTDDAYVFRGERPQAESGTDLFGRETNKAGIDLGFWVGMHLGITDGIHEVEWEPLYDAIHAVDLRLVS